MRVVNKALLILAVSCLVCTAALTQMASAAQNGITLSPAMLNLTLPEGTSEQTASFAITNNYAVPVTIAFAFERPLDDPSGAQDPADILRVSQNSVAVAAGKTATQTVSLLDSKDVQPGSQRAELVVSVLGAAGANVAVQSTIRMPVSIIKQSGAVSSLQISGLNQSAFRLTPPGFIEAMIINDGNVVAIPRGVVTVRAPGGSIVSQGVLNTASQAISPNTNFAFGTQLEKLGNAVWPGLYKVDVRYGLGGGQPAKTASYTYFYVAWWHALTGAVLALAVYFGLRRYTPNPLRKKPRAHPPPGHHKLAERRSA